MHQVSSPCSRYISLCILHRFVGSGCICGYHTWGILFFLFLIMISYTLCVREWALALYSFLEFLRTLVWTIIICTSSIWSAHFIIFCMEYFVYTLYYVYHVAIKLYCIPRLPDWVKQGITCKQIFKPMHDKIKLWSQWILIRSCRALQ